MTEREDHEPLADELDREADKLAEQSTRLEDEIGGVRDDWRHKRGDPGVPGAVPEVDDADREKTADKDADGPGTADKNARAGR